MGWFRKKSDPISERSQALNQEIARLEAQIRALSEQQSAAVREQPDPPPEPAPVPAAPVRPPPPPAEPAPRLRSTALPQRHKSNKRVEEQPEIGLEAMAHNPFKLKGDRASQPGRDLGLGESDFSGLWKRFKRQFRAPVASNPRLVSYLAAGSIQGLRPLRYEKRVARNRTILLLVCFVLILWGVLAIVIR